MARDNEVDLKAMRGACLIQAPRFPDPRGFLQVSWNSTLSQKAGIETEFLQDNLVKSQRGVLRGMHYQNPDAQGKLLTVLDGEILDVILDVRAESPTFGKWAAVSLRAEDPSLLWVPRGFAHGYQVVSETSLVQYKVDAAYRPEQEISIDPLDIALDIAWPLEHPLLSEKDKKGFSMLEAPRYRSVGGLS